MSTQSNDEKPREFWIHSHGDGDTVTSVDPGDQAFTHVIEKSYADGLAERLAETEVSERLMQQKLDELVIENDRLRNGRANERFDMQTELSRIRAQNEVLKQACEFYADRSVWVKTQLNGDSTIARGDNSYIESIGMYCGGEAARGALQEAELLAKGEE